MSQIGVKVYRQRLKDPAKLDPVFVTPESGRAHRKDASHQLGRPVVYEQRVVTDNVNDINDIDDGIRGSSVLGYNLKDGGDITLGKRAGFRKRLASLLNGIVLDKGTRHKPVVTFVEGDKEDNADEVVLKDIEEVLNEYPKIGEVINKLLSSKIAEREHIVEAGGKVPASLYKEIAKLTSDIADTEHILKKTLDAKEMILEGGQETGKGIPHYIFDNHKTYKNKIAAIWRDWGEEYQFYKMTPQKIVESIDHVPAEVMKYVTDVMKRSADEGNPLWKTYGFSKRLKELGFNPYMVQSLKNALSKFAGPRLSMLSRDKSAFNEAISYPLVNAYSNEAARQTDSQFYKEAEGANKIVKGTGALSDENLKNKLTTAAAGYKGTDNIQQQLMAEAAANGQTGPEVVAMIDEIIKKINKSETGKKGNAFGVAHDPVKQTHNLGRTIQDLRF